MLRILLDNDVVEYGVLGLDGITEELELKKDLHGYVYQVQGTITFVQSDYAFLRQLFDDGYCTDVLVDIQHSTDFGQSWTSKIKALIKLVGVKWDRVKRMAECPIVDNSFQSKINNNRQIVFQLGDHSGTVLSKNGVDVSSKVVFHNNVQLFSPFRGRYFEDECTYTKTDPPFPASEGNDFIDLRPQAKVGMFPYDAFNLLIAMMTDNEVDFASDYFSYDLNDLSTTRDEAAALIMSGGHIRHGSTYPKLNFEQYFNDMHKLNNVWFTMEMGTGGKPRMRIEDEDYFRQANSGVYFNSVKSMLESTDLGKIYSKVLVGCSVSSGGNFPVGSIPLVNHVQEEFPLSGTCNVNNELNLRLEKLIINTNSIAEALPPISGFSSSGLRKKKFTNEAVSSGPHQLITDSNGNYKEDLIAERDLIKNSRTGEWSYIEGVPSGTQIRVFDELLAVSGSGPTKDYEIHTPTEDTQFKDEVFLIQIDRSTSDSTAIYANKTIIDPPADLYYYNETFANYKVIERHMGGVPQSIVSSLSDGNDQFQAEFTLPDVLSDTDSFIPLYNSYYRRIVFNDDVNSPNFDTNGNYDALTGLYTAPQGGYYSCHAEVEFTNQCGTDLIQIIEISRATATGETIESFSDITTILDGTASFIFTLDHVFYLAEGEKLQVVIKQPFNPSIIGSYAQEYVPWSEFVAAIPGPPGFGTGYGVRNIGNSIFYVDFLFNGGGLVPASDPEEVRLLNFETELSVSRETFDSVLANPFKYYHTNLAPVYENPHYQTGYIGKISRGILNGECTMTQFKKMDGV